MCVCVCVCVCVCMRVCVCDKINFSTILCRVYANKMQDLINARNSHSGTFHNVSYDVATDDLYMYTYQKIMQKRIYF